MWYRVTSINAANDWLFADVLDAPSLPTAPDTLITKTYSPAGDFLAFSDSEARLSATACSEPASEQS